MACEYRTLLPLIMCCGRRKKRLKNLDHSFCHCYNIRHLHKINAQVSDEYVSNNDRSEIMNIEKSEHSQSSRKSSKHVMTCRNNNTSAAVKVKPSIYSYTTIFMISLIIILLKHGEMIEAFNLDMGTRVVFSQPPSTMFGFSVAGHKEGNVGW